MASLDALLKLCEERQLTSLAKGLKEQFPDSKSAPPKDFMEIVRDAIVKEDKRQRIQQQRKTGGKPTEKPVKQRPTLSFNKDENEEIMENLMNRIVAKPNFGEETASKHRIEKLMAVPAFQKMVDQADLL